MATCGICSEDYQPVPSAWPEGTCGECIAAQLELLLMRDLMGDERKPPRRALREQDIEVIVEEVKRQA
jgi:hypothetical protein